MKHTFVDESKLDVREYITKKIQLYTEAGKDREDLIVRRLYQGLDLTLVNTVPLRVSNLNTIRDFTAKVYVQEPSTRAQFKQYESYFKQSSSSSARPQRPEQRDRDKSDQREFQQDRSRPFQIPVEAARRLVTYPTAVHVQITSTAATRPDAPPLPRIGAEFALKGEAASTPWSTRRERYPCTHCQSTEHIDPQCPKRPPRNRN
jgi:hypothetical protein